MKRNQVLFAVGLAMVAIVVSSVAGCDIKDVLRVKTPIEVQREKGIPASLTLRESEDQYEAWLADTQRVGAQWRGNIERSTEILGLLQQLALTGLDAAGPTLGSVPVLAPILPVVTGLAGLWLGKREGRKEGVEKIASFNKGSEVERERAKAGGTEA